MVIVLWFLACWQWLLYRAPFRLPIDGPGI